MSADVDIRVMGCRQREPLIRTLLERLDADPEIVTYDDRPAGGDCMYTAKKTWFEPVPVGATHRLVLTDDAEVCDDFQAIVTRMATAFPFAFFTLYNGRMKWEHRRRNSPYVSCPGGNCYGVAIMMPVFFIDRVFAWSDTFLGKNFKHDDNAVGEYADSHGILLLTTIPSTVQHKAPMASLLGYNNPKKVTKVWKGPDLTGENWDTSEYTVGPYQKNSCLPKGYVAVK